MKELIKEAEMLYKRINDIQLSLFGHALIMTEKEIDWLYLKWK